MSKLDEALGLFPSCIKSGERWSPTCQAVLDAAKTELKELRARAAHYTFPPSVTLDRLPTGDEVAPDPIATQAIDTCRFLSVLELRALRKRWEYRVEHGSLSEARLSELGVDGWALVHVVASSLWIFMRKVAQ